MTADGPNALWLADINEVAFHVSRTSHRGYEASMTIVDDKGALEIGAVVFGMTTEGVIYADGDPDWFQFFVGAMLPLATAANT